MADEEESLISVFELFKENQKLIDELLSDVQSSYDALEVILAGIRKKRHSDLTIDGLLISEDDVHSIQQTFQEPKIVLVGQTNAGKSSLINELLGATIVKAEDTPCTARIVELKYGDTANPVVEIFSKDEKKIETLHLDKPFIPSGVANLPHEDRDKAELIGSKVVARIKNEFLRSGVTVVDSPGKNEYEEMDKMVEQHMFSVLPLVVYVIDGRNMLSKKDQEDIQSLMHAVPKGNIFFVVTKCDDPDFMERDEFDSDSEDEDEDGAASNDRLKPTKIEMEIKEGIYKKLVDKGMVDNRTIDQCQNYHALSSRYVKKFRWAQKKPENKRSDDDRQALRECQRFMDDFLRFKKSLMEFVKAQLIETLCESCKTIEISLRGCLDYFIDKSNTIHNNKQRNEEMIYSVQSQEADLHREALNEVSSMKAEIIGDVRNVLKSKRSDVIGMAKEYVFTGFKVPKDGYIDKNSVEQYKEQLAKQILTNIGGLIHQEVMKRCKRMDDKFTKLTDKAKQAQKKAEEDEKARKTDATDKQAYDIHGALEQMFIRRCKFSIADTNLKLSIWKKIAKFFKDVWRFIKRIFTSFNVHSTDWREALAKDILNGIQAEEVADEVVGAICDHVGNGHAVFVKKMKALRQLFENGFRLGEEDRELIREKAPAIAKLLLRTLSIPGHLRYRNLRLGQMLGCPGAEGVVFACNAKRRGGGECAIKMIPIPEEGLGKVGLEIHYARMLKHPNVMEILGVIQEDRGSDMYTVGMIMARMKGDLIRELPTITNLKRRLVIGWKVGQALEYIHSLQLMHRDIKPGNVLVDYDGTVKISDFGHCKPPGISNRSLAGTPMFVAPEVLQRSFYNIKVDVYSFGILLWCIYEGNNRVPEYVKKCNGLSDLEQKISSGCRPEKLSGMLEDCWRLMSQCWDGKPERRPTMTEVNRGLRRIIANL